MQLQFEPTILVRACVWAGQATSRPAEISAVLTPIRTVAYAVLL